MSKKVIISACLLGEQCRYDGKTKKVNAILDAFKEYEIIPFCPEAPLFGTPRERISVIEIDKTQKIITDETNVDVTTRLEEEIHAFCANNAEVDAIVLKSKSPSCGNGTTAVLNKRKELVGYGDGIAAKIFKKVYTDVSLKDELSYLSF